MKESRFPLLVAMLLTATNVVLIWSYRFLPLGDYALWLFASKVLRSLSEPLSFYREYYEVVAVPIPNVSFTVFSLFVSHLVSLEVTGKLFMTLIVAAFPWSVWYSVRSVATHPDPAAGYLGFPFFFNMFMFGSQNYLLGVALMLFVIGYFLPRLTTLSPVGWLFLGAALLLNYFTHAITFFLVLVVFLGAAFSSGTDRWKRVGRVCLAAIPSVVCFLWYAASNPVLPSGPSSWGLGTIARSALKPLLLFSKSFGIGNPIPLSVCNGIWILLLVFLLLALVRKSRAREALDFRFLPAVVVSGIMMIVMPSVGIGVTQPGARFCLPLLFFGVFFMLRARLPGVWKAVFLAAALFATLYNVDHFRKVNDQSTAFFEDLTKSVDLTAPFYLLRYDWSTEEAMRDRLSLSVDPLSLVPYYACLERDCICWIHETSFVRLRPEFQWYRPDIVGETIPEFYASIMAHRDSLRRFRSLVVLGSGKEAENTINEFASIGYRPVVVQPLWTILRSD